VQVYVEIYANSCAKYSISLTICLCVYLTDSHFLSLSLSLSLSLPLGLYQTDQPKASRPSLHFKPPVYDLLQHCSRKLSAPVLKKKKSCIGLKINLPRSCLQISLYRLIINNILVEALTCLRPPPHRFSRYDWTKKIYLVIFFHW
jgi:hypothetical protein